MTGAPVARCDHASSVGAYLLGALPPADASAFAEHLLRCEWCWGDLRHLRPARETLLADVVQINPPAELKRRIMADVEAQAELLRAAGPRADRAPRVAWWRSPRAFAFAFAAAALVAVVLGSQAIWGGGNDRRVIDAAVDTRLAPGAQAKLIVSGADATLRVTGLAPPPAGRVYEVWLRRTATGTPEPTHTLFDVARDGNASVAVGDLRHVRAIMVTAEPAGGSPRPTSGPVVSARLD